MCAWLPTAGGSVTNDGLNGDFPPATLAILPGLYMESFGKVDNGANEPVSNDGWLNDIFSGDGNVRLENTFDGVIYPANDGDIYDYDSAGAGDMAFYTSCALETGTATPTAQMPLGQIPVEAAPNLQFFLDVAGDYNPGSALDYFAVQINGANWYVSITPLLTPVTAWGQYSNTFDPSAGMWDDLTVSGTGSYANPNPYPVVGSATTNALSGYITGVGVVTVFSGSATHHLDNFMVLGTVPLITLPVINYVSPSQTAIVGTNVQLVVNATTNYLTAGLTYQWYARATGSGNPFTPVPNSGQYSGATSQILTIANVNTPNNQDFEVVVTDGAGSVTSSPPTTLTVENLPPTPQGPTEITPQSTLRTGNHVPVVISANVLGSEPMLTQWQKSPNANGSGAVNVPGATSQTLTLYPLPSDSGYYSLFASNAIAPHTTNTTWALLTVLPPGTYQFSAPVQYATPSFNMTPGQILTNTPGEYVDSFSAAGVPVTNNGVVYTFNNPANDLALLYTDGSDTWAGPGWGLYGTTGDPNMDADIGEWYFDTGGPTNAFGQFVHEWDISNLESNGIYSLQLFSSDTRSPENLRTTFYEDPNDNSDISAINTNGNMTYFVATFTASSNFMVLDHILPNGAGNDNAAILRLVAAPPPILQNGQLSWNPNATLLQATNILGPWTTNTGTPPITLYPPFTSPQMFFKTRQ